MEHLGTEYEAKFNTFLTAHRSEIRWEDGNVRRRTRDYFPVATDRIVRSMEDCFPGAELEQLPRDGSLPDRLSEWILSASESELALADLTLKRPPAGIHCVPGRYPIYYDFENLDIALTELLLAGASFEGNLLDFGCSSGRNLAVLERAFGENLKLYGADPSEPSINWVHETLPKVNAVCNEQDPPLPFESGIFDLVIAKSIWTHFSRRAAIAWFEEISRCLAPGGFFFFSTHGRHDIASRIVFDVPRPQYEKFDGHSSWTRNEFIAAAIGGLAESGFYFQPFKEVGQQGDLKGARDADTSDWGVTFYLPHYIKSILPCDLRLVRYSVARTGNRHDAYVLRKSGTSDIA